MKMKEEKKKLKIETQFCIDKFCHKVYYEEESVKIKKDPKNVEKLRVNCEMSTFCYFL